MREMRKQLGKAETAIARFRSQLEQVDRAMADPAKANAPFAGQSLEQMARHCATLASDLEKAEAHWLELSEKLEA